MRTFKTGDIWGGVTLYMPETFSQLAEKACDFVQNETDQDTHIMAGAGYGSGHQINSCVMYHTQGRQNPPALQRFTDIEPQLKDYGTMRTDSHLCFSEELSKFCGGSEAAGARERFVAPLHFH